MGLYLKRYNLGKNLSAGYAVGASTGYYTYTLYPMALLSMQYKNLRLSTSDPIASAMKEASVYNLQLVFKL